MGTQEKKSVKSGRMLVIFAVIGVAIAAMAITGGFNQKDADGFTASNRKIANEAISIARDGCASNNNLVYQMKLADAKQMLRKIDDASQEFLAENMMDSRLRSVGCKLN